MVIAQLAKMVALAILALGIALLGYGTVVEPYTIGREDETVSIPGLPVSWEGKRIALISDVQAGMWLANLPTARRIVSLLVAERPAAVLIAGDLIYEPLPDPTREVGAVVELLRPLAAAGIPTYAVLGNHDYALSQVDATAGERPDARPAASLRRALEEMGVRVLRNEVASLAPGTAAAGVSENGVGGPGPGGSEALYLVGIGPHLAGEDEPVAAVRRVPAGAPRIVFMHHPASFEPLPPGSAPLALAGHTHGGQIRLPWAPEWSMVVFVVGRPLDAAGWVNWYAERGQPDNRLYISRGIGFSTVPIRLFCPPEVTFFTLTR